MRVTIVLPFVNLTGGIRAMLDFANGLHDAGHETTVVHPCWPYRFHFTRREQWSEFRRHLRDNGGIAWFPLRARLCRVPAVAGPFVPPADVVVATSWPTVRDVARLPASRGAKVHFVMHHEAGTGPEERIRRNYSRPFHRVAFSEFIRHEIETRFGCVIHDIAPPGVDPHLFYPEGAPEARTVLLLFHPDPRKGADAGLEALTRVRSRVPDLTVRVCGTVRPARLPDGIDFQFHPADSALRALYSTSTLLLYPSRYEGFGLPPLEAMACGCPSVTTAVGAVPEYAADRRDALVVPIGNIEAMVDRMAELLGDPALRARLSAAGRQTAARHSLAATAPRFSAALVRAVTSSRSVRRRPGV